MAAEARPREEFVGMAMERGGRSTKLGNTYERLWAVRHALYVIESRERSVLWEPVGEDENGIDLWVVKNDGTRVGHQLKRENESKEHWSVADLQEAGVLEPARQQLERQASSEFVFVSSHGARHIRDLAEQSRRSNDDATLFTRDLVAANKERKAAFKTLLTAWGFDPERPPDAASGFRLLQRMTFEVQERTQAARDEIGFIAGLLIAGDPAGIVAIIGDLLDNNLGRVLHADDLRQMLQDRGLRFRSLVGDPSLAAAVSRLQGAFDSAIAGSLIASVPIGRPEVDELLTKVRGEQPPRLVFVHGGAGSGKSVVLHQAFMALQAAAIPCLPVQLHARPPAGSPDTFGRTKLDLPASPALSLRGVAGERRAVLMLDQLDALRLTSANSHEAWQACSEVIDEALADPAMTVIVACRTFDLENDPKIGAWKRHSLHRPPGTAVEVKIGDLPQPAVAELVGRHGVAFAALPARQQRLLRQPGPLALWWSLASAGELAAADNATALMRQFLALRRRDCTREHGIPESNLATVLSTLVTYLDKHGCLAAPDALFAHHGPTIDAMCSVGLLRRDGPMLNFVHQSYFDHLIAEQVLAAALGPGDDPFNWVRANQSLFRRDQLRQLLTLLRDANPTSHEALARAVLLAPDLRFHLKHLVLGLLSQADPPLEHEVRLIVELADRPEWRDHVIGSVLWSKLPWFDALERGGHLARWLARWTDDASVRILLRFCRSVAEHRGEKVDGLLALYWDAGEPWSSRLAEAAGFDPSDDSPGMAAFRIRMIRAGEWQTDGMFLDRMAEKTPMRITPFLEAALLAWADRVQAYTRAAGEGRPPDWRFRDTRLGPGVLAAIRADAARAWAAFSRLLRFFKTLRRMAAREVRSLDDIKRLDFALRHGLDEAAEFVQALVAASVEGLAAGSPTETIELLLSLTVPKIRGLEQAIAGGLLAGDPSLADAAIIWLCDRPSRFHLGDGYEELYWKPATDLIVRFAPACSQPIFDRLQTTVLSFHDEYEQVSMRFQSARARARATTLATSGVSGSITCFTPCRPRGSPHRRGTGPQLGGPSLATPRPIAHSMCTGRHSTSLPPSRPTSSDS